MAKKLYLPAIKEFYEDGLFLGVFDSREEAQDRLDSYLRNYPQRDANDQTCIIVTTLNEKVVIDI